MCSADSGNNAMINLGFTGEAFPKGTHVCQIYSDEEEREASLLAFLRSGLEANERVACFSDKSTEEIVCSYLNSQGFDSNALKASAQLTTSPTRPVYFENNHFDPDAIIERVRQFQDAADHDGQSAARIIGEMHPCIDSIDGGNRLMEYEAKVGLLQETCPVTAVCQYNVAAFDGATIMNVLKVHPLMIVSGAVIRNPFFVPCREVLAQQGCC